MSTAYIKLMYKQIIDASSTGNFEQNVFQATYNEFKLKSQTYNPKGNFKTYTELKTNDGVANSINYTIGFVAGTFIDGLNHRIPGLVDNLGNAINFDVATLELLESDLTNNATHQLAINYSTDTLTLCDIVGEYLILAKGEVQANHTAETFTVKLQSNLSIAEFHIQDHTEIPFHFNNN